MDGGGDDENWTCEGGWKKRGVERPGHKRVTILHEYEMSLCIKSCETE